MPYGAEPQRRIVRNDGLGQIGQLNRDAAVLRDPEARQRRREAIDLILQLPVGEAAVQEHDGGRVGIPCRRALEELGQCQVFKLRAARNAWIVMLKPGPIIHECVRTYAARRAP